MVLAMPTALTYNPLAIQVDHVVAIRGATCRGAQDQTLSCARQRPYRLGVPVSALSKWIVRQRQPVSEKLRASDIEE